MTEHKQFKKDVIARTTTQLAHSIVTDLHSLSKTVKAGSKAVAEVHADLANRIILVSGDELMPVIKQLLMHLLHIIELKGAIAGGLAILGKVISLVKVLQEGREEKSKEMRQFIQKIVDILVVVNNRQKEGEIALRVVQNTFSLIEPGLLEGADYHLSTRLYSICFKCCLLPQIQSISASALFSLTDILFRHHFTKDLSTILIDLLEILLHNKKSQWVKDLELKGIVWDVVLIAVKSISEEDWRILGHDKVLVELLTEMFRVSMQNSFSRGQNLIEHDLFRNTIRLEHEKSHSNHQKKDLMVDYIKYYKVFIYFSIHLSLKLKEEEEIVPFRKHLNIFHNLYDYPRSIRFYILLQGIVLVVNHGNTLILEEEGGIMLVDVFQKVCEQLYASKLPFQVVWQNSELLIDKMFGDYSKISDQDYLKITKNMLVRLRKSFENDKSGIQIKEEESADVSLSQTAELKNQNKESGAAYRWRRLIKSVIRIIRYLTSLNFKENSNDQAIRRFLMQLQNWFVLCPTHKTRNTVLLELQHITSSIQNKNQAIKASQCMQICSNILYGFYGRLNSVGISTILRIMANIKVNCILGKDFNELDEVCLMADKFYIQQRIIGTQQEFTVTVEGFVQCMNLMVADMQLPSEKEGKDREMTEKYLRLIDYVLLKLKFILQENVQFLDRDWSFIICFWVSMCSNKQTSIRNKTMAHIQSVFTVFLKNSMISEKEILNSYTELSKLDIGQVSKQIIEQIKKLLPYLRDERALMEITQIIRELSHKRYSGTLRGQLSELQEMLIKESLFKIKSQQSLLHIIDSLNFKGKSKNEEYVTVSLLWNMADHLKALHLQSKDPQEELWKRLFTKINELAKITDHPGTRQSCILTFTQIIADCSADLGEQLFFRILTQEYLEIFCLLLGFDESVPKLESLVQVEMEKVAIKNFIKLVRKCLHQREDKIDLGRLLESSMMKLLSFIQKSGKELPVQYFIQLCELLTFLKELHQEESKFKKTQELSNLVRRTLLEIEKKHEFLDQSTYTWKKKYFPVFGELRDYFNQQ